MAHLFMFPYFKIFHILIWKKKSQNLPKKNKQHKRFAVNNQWWCFAYQCSHTVNNGIRFYGTFCLIDGWKCFAAIFCCFIQGVGGRVRSWIIFTSPSNLSNWSSWKVLQRFWNPSSIQINSCICRSLTINIFGLFIRPLLTVFDEKKNHMKWENYNMFNVLIKCISVILSHKLGYSIKTIHVKIKP